MTQLNIKKPKVQVHRQTRVYQQCKEAGKEKLAFESAAGGVAIASSVIGANPSTVTPDPSADTPLKQKVNHIPIDKKKNRCPTPSNKKHGNLDLRNP